MKPIKFLLAVLPHTSWNDPQMEEQRQLQRLALYFLGGGPLLLAISALFHLFDEKWINIILLTIPVITMLVLVLFLRKRFPLTQRLGLEALRLRAAAEGEGEQLAQLAPEQPAPLSTEGHSSSDLRLGPLWGRKNTRTYSTIFGIVLICMPVVVGAIVWITLSQQAFSQNPIMLFVFFVIIIVCIPFVLGSIQSLQWTRRTVQGAYVLVDERGFHWQRPLPTKTSVHYSIDWKQARSFFMIAAAEPGTDKWLRGYALDAHSLLLTWQISHRSSAQERAASDMLCRLIVTHTLLPLRDLSAAAEQISQQIESGQQVNRDGLLPSRRAEDD